MPPATALGNTEVVYSELIIFTAIFHFFSFIYCLRIVRWKDPANHNNPRQVRNHRTVGLSDGKWSHFLGFHRLFSFTLIMKLNLNVSSV